MKKTVYTAFAIFFCLALAACGGNGPVSKAKDALAKLDESYSEAKEAAGTLKNLSKIAANAEKKMKAVNQLAQAEPVPNDALKNWLPENTGDFKRTAYAAGKMSAMGISSINAVFTDKKDKNKTIQLEVTDGAGALSSSIIGIKTRLESDFEEETEYGFSRNIEKNGLDAYEKQNDKTHRSELQYVIDSRFLIKLSGKNTTVDELWQMVDKLNTDKLTSLKP